MRNLRRSLPAVLALVAVPAVSCGGCSELVIGVASSVRKPCANVAPAPVSTP